MSWLSGAVRTVKLNEREEPLATVALVHTHSLASCSTSTRVPVDARVEPHISHRLRIRRVEVEHEATAFAWGELGRLPHADEFVHLADGGEVLGGGRGHKERGDDEERKGQGRGPHVTRRSWSPLIYISRSISSKRVKPAIPFARRMPVLAVARERAEDLLQELMALQLVDETRKITKSGREILIPVVGEPPIPLARHGARW